MTTNPPLTDITRRARRMDRTHAEDRAQIIYATGAGLDYARHTAPEPISTHDDAAAWARANFERVADATARRFVSCFYVEWF